MVRFYTLYMQRSSRVPFKLIKPFLLSHHPHCKHFEDDVYHMGRHRLCIGCFTSYPIALVVVALWFLNTFSYSWFTLILLGLGFGLVQLLSFSHLTDKKGVKVLVKVFLGLGFGFFTSGVLAMPLPLWFRMITIINGAFASGMLGYFRYKKVEKICQICEYKGNYQICPGFSDIYGSGEHKLKK